MDGTALGELSPGLSHTAPKAHQGAQAGAETGQTSVCPCLVEKKIIKLFLSLIVLRLHFSCSLETQLEKSAHLQAPRKVQNAMSLPQKGALFPSKFPRAQMPRVAFPHSHWTKDYSIFLSSGKSVREKGKAVGKELLLAPSAGSTSSFASNSTQLAPSTATPPAGAVLLPDRCWSIRGFTSWDRKGESFGDGQAQGGTLEDSG